MAYYRIKCPYCLKDVKSDDVLFPTQGNEETFDQGSASSPISARSEQTFGHNDGEEKPVFGRVNLDFAEDNPFQDGGEKNTVSREIKTEADSVEKYLTLEGFSRYFSEIEETRNAEIKMAPYYLQGGNDEQHDDAELDKGLLTSIEYRDLSGTRRTALERHCPHCGNRLNPLAGIMPTYIILLMGSSSSGKTVYLTSLYLLLGGLSEGSDELPCLGKLSLSNAEINEKFPIAKYAEDLREKGNLPEATTDLLTEPLPLKVTVQYGKRENGYENMIDCLLFLRDIPGEVLGTDNARMRGILSQVRNFDGFLLLLDPLTMEHARNFSLEAATEDAFESRRQQLEDLRKTIRTNIAAAMPGNARITAPTLVVLTKGDYFHRSSNNISIRRIAHNPAIGMQELQDIMGGRGIILDSRYIEEQNRGTKIIIDMLSGGMSSDIESTFTNTFFMIVSSLGIGVNDIFDAQTQSKRVDNINLLKPWRIKESCVLLLMSMGILPPFNSMEGPPHDKSESSNDRELRLSRNFEKLNEWGGQHCAGWKEQNPPQRGKKRP
jgi:hypothetical protein